MKLCKTMAILSVLVMLSAGMAFIGCDADSMGEGDNNTVTVTEPLVIDKDTPSKEFEDFNAKYDKEASTLTFNGCDCSYTGTAMVDIENYSGASPISIFFNGTTKLTFTGNDGINDCYGFVVNRCCNIFGPGELYVNLKTPTVTVDNSRQYGVCFSKNTYVDNLKITIDVDCNDSFESVNGLAPFGPTTMIDSKITIGGHSEVKQLNCISVNDKLNLIKCDLHLTMDNKNKVSCNGIFAMSDLRIIDSVLDIRSYSSYTSNGTWGIRNDENTIIIDSIVNIKLSETDKGTGIYAGTSLYELGSDIVIDVPTTSIEPDGSKNLSFEKLLGWKDGVSKGEITIDDIENCNKIHLINPMSIAFDLCEGEGTAVEPVNAHTGDVIILPECDAKKDGKVFIGWTDGKNQYKAGDEYTVTINATLYAVYGEPAHTSNGIDMGVVALLSIFVIAIAGILIAAYSRRY